MIEECYKSGFLFISVHMQFFTVDAGLVLIRGQASQKYLAMNSRGILRAEVGFLSTFWYFRSPNFHAMMHVHTSIPRLHML